jgi:hypothetical protein
VRVREINRIADDYLKANARALLAEAWQRCQGCPSLMKLYEKEMKDRQRALQRRAQNSQHSFSSEVR